MLAKIASPNLFNGYITETRLLGNSGQKKVKGQKMRALVLLLVVASTAAANADPDLKKDAPLPHLISILQGTRTMVI